MTKKELDGLKELLEAEWIHYDATYNMLWWGAEPTKRTKEEIRELKGEGYANYFNVPGQGYLYENDVRVQYKITARQHSARLAPSGGLSQLPGCCGVGVVNTVESVLSGIPKKVKGPFLRYFIERSAYDLNIVAVTSRQKEEKAVIEASGCFELIAVGKSRMGSYPIYLYKYNQKEHKGFEKLQEKVNNSSPKEAPKSEPVRKVAPKPLLRRRQVG
jgi:hypothetical protein